MISGQMIAGKYRINQLLGSGGMASVWSATNVFTDRQFAIKLMLPQVARTQEAARRFLLEAKVSARVDHPNIIEVIDVGQTEDGSLFLVMELLNGMSLEAAMRRRSPAMTAAEFATVMVHVARALAAAHKSGVIHRDLKPTNIYLHQDRDGVAVPKLLDFGVSKFLEDDSNHSLTVAGTVLGSPLYMSPEQAKGAVIDARTDVFAFGAILFEALCGFRPYEAANFNALIVAIATTPPKSIDEHAPHVPEALRSLVRDCMVTDREKRIAAFDEVADRLAACIPELEASGITLRAPARTEADGLSDPDATNALPVRSLSLSGSGASTGPRSSGAPTSHSTPWGTPSGAHVVSTASEPRKSRVAYGVGAATVVAAVALLAVIASRGSTPKPAMAVAATPVERPAPAVEATPAAATTVPVISVESLPVAGRGGADRGTGRVVVTAGPGTCAVTVDSTPRGATPTAAFELPAGAHQVRCDGPSGKSKVAQVVVQDGATARVKFTVEP